jgi:hypothetical protein
MLIKRCNFQQFLIMLHIAVYFFIQRNETNKIHCFREKPLTVYVLCQTYFGFSWAIIKKLYNKKCIMIQ